jgi:putative transposase
MPWKETCPMEERVAFVTAVNESGESFAELCRRFGISRKTGYKWMERYEKEGAPGLERRAPIAHHCPHQTSAEMVEAVLAVRKEHSTWGPKKVRAWLEDPGGWGRLPAHSTIAQILSEHGLVRPRRRRLRTPPGAVRLVPGVEPNELWCVDFKGHFALGDKTRCYPLTITDHASRYLIACVGMACTKEPLVRARFEQTFREFGLPDRIRSDNGVPFASVGVAGLSALSVWWIKLGIVPERIEPGHPEQNGRHERMHKTLNLDAVQPPQGTLGEQQRVFDRFRHEYNDQRPHEALAMKTPRSRYAISRRVLPERPRSPAYADGTMVRIVDDHGCIRHRADKVLLTRLLIAEPVSLVPHAEECWRLFFGPVLLGELHYRNKKLRLERVVDANEGSAQG